MWAYVKSNKIEEIIRFPKTITIDNVTHSRKIFTAWSVTDLNAIGIYTVEITTGIKDEKFYDNSQPTYKFDATNKKITSTVTSTEKALNDSEAKDYSGKNILDEKGNKTYNYGLKTLAKEQAKQKANNLINRFNWLVERSIYDSSKAIPSAVKTYVAEIRKNCSDIETAIDNAADMTAFQKLYEWEYNSDGTVKTVAPIQNWSNDYDVKTYIR